MTCRAHQLTFIYAICISGLVETQFENPKMSYRKRPLYLSGKSLDVTQQAVDGWIEENKHTNPHMAELFSRHLTNKPVCHWIGDWTTDPKLRVIDIVNHAKETDSLYQLVLYNVPNRDLRGFSAGGTESRDKYLSWIREVAAGVGSAEGVIIVEPDALAHSLELDQNRRDERLRVIRDAVTIIRGKCKNAHIYIDAGHPTWLKAEVAVELLTKAGIRLIDGISLNVANSHTTETCYQYGLRILEAISDSHGMVIDVSRNGAGPPPPQITGTDAWANVATNRLGQAPTLSVQSANNFSSRLHGLLWIKVPGESDGEYKTAPAAGLFWPEGAMTLVENETQKRVTRS